MLLVEQTSVGQRPQVVGDRAERTPAGRRDFGSGPRTPRDHDEDCDPGRCETPTWSVAPGFAVYLIR